MNNLVLQQSQDGMNRAVLSDDGVYRYSLSRRWPAPPGIVLEPKILPFVMLNPSTADALVDDPTIRRCIGFAKSLDYDGILVRNLYALRSKDPSALKEHRDPIGPANPAALLGIADPGDIVVCAWGANSFAEKRGQDIAKAMRENWGFFTMALGVTKSGAPRHPLYVHGDTRLQEYK